jgi:DNA-binding NarL/FixJ family response regulator
MAKSNTRTRILIVDDHPLFRDGLRRFIDSQTDMVCCAEADSVQTVLDAVNQHNPDLILLDLRLRGEDSMETLKNLTTQDSKRKILVLSQKDESLYAEPVLRAGARGYIMKEEATEELLSAIHSVLRGELYVSRRLSGLILRKFLTGVGGDGVASALSDRELQVFQFIGSGLGMQQIAEQLHLSVKTVETHRENIKHKLGFADSGGLLQAARDWVQSSER